MLSKNQISHIAALKNKKYREESQQFMAEGHKLVLDLIHSKFNLSGIYASSEWIHLNRTEPEAKDIPVFEVSPAEMERISALSTPSQVLAVVKMETLPLTSSPAHHLTNTLSLALDDIRDPGNLGTIIRIADWFGLDTVFCSPSSVDLYNPKVVQATMGSISRVKVIYLPLHKLLLELEGQIPVYGSMLEGQSIFDQTLSNSGIILIGNESKGISPGLIPWITRRMFIPYYGKNDDGRVESLNASMAAAIICAEFRRQTKVH